MNDMSKMRNLSDIDKMRQQLKKNANRQQALVERDIKHIERRIHSYTDGFSRVKNIFGAMLPKMEYATVLFPVLKRILRRK